MKNIALKDMTAAELLARLGDLDDREDAFKEELRVLGEALSTLGDEFGALVAQTGAVAKSLLKIARGEAPAGTTNVDDLFDENAVMAKRLDEVTRSRWALRRQQEEVSRKLDGVYTRQSNAKRRLRELGWTLKIGGWHAPIAAHEVTALVP